MSKIPNEASNGGRFKLDLESSSPVLLSDPWAKTSSGAAGLPPDYLSSHHNLLDAFGERVR